MAKMILIVLVLALTGCATERVNVDLDSCQRRGNIDKINVGACIPVKVVR